MRKLRRPTAWGLCIGLAAQAVMAPYAPAAEPVYKIYDTIKRPFEAVLCREKPPACEDESVQELARQIDWLEHHIDAFGSIVAKQPDVWGESRLTQHREEFEKQMVTQLNQFQPTLNAAIRRSDQSYLSMAMALQAASKTATLPTLEQQSTAINNLTAMVTPGATLGAPAAGTTTPTVTDLSKTQAVFRSAPFGLGDASTGAGVNFGTGASLSLEPTVFLNQMANYLKHLQELRRIGEGDDTADSPGYALDLVRIPVSILPGKHTRRGYGAEITVTATPYLTEDLLPKTFRNLVIKDVVDMLAPVVTYILNCEDSGYSPEEEQIPPPAPTSDPTGIRRGPRTRSTVQYASATSSTKTSSSKSAQLGIRSFLRERVLESPQAAAPAPLFGKATPEQIDSASASASEMVTRAAQNTLHSVGGKSRRARMPLPPSQLASVLGGETLLAIVTQAYKSLHHAGATDKTIHLMDVRAYLGEELQASYEFLSSAPYLPMWDAFCSPEVVETIRLNQAVRVSKIRAQFARALGHDDGLIEHLPPISDASELSGDLACDSCAETNSAAQPCQITTLTGALSWAIMVEAALLNAHLIKDMQSVAVSKGCGCLNVTDPRFYQPQPTPEACETFAQYVKCRWPIHVFAIEPTSEDQNIADAYSRRREMQLALAAAFAGGKIGGQAMMRYSRRLEWDMATIALNRTQIAFSHGDNTFGWRFYPRFQTPPVKGTLSAFGETLFGGPTSDQDIRDRELEPGMRECVAIVIMPSFVPYVTFDTHTNWFKLTNPKKTEISTVDMMKLSKSIKSMQSAQAMCAQNAACYRDGEISRLMRRVSQLDHELPLQTMQVQIPFENNLGGFEMFNNGLTDLTPELIGWYGEPGIDRTGNTTLFLIGDKFSVHGTHVIAGNRPVEHKLLSRQVMQVLIPPGCQTIDDPNATDNREAVDIHLGTPYGVTTHLLVPVAPKAVANPDVTPHLQLSGPAITMTYVENKPDAGKPITTTVNAFFVTSPQQIAVSVLPNGLPVGAAASITFACSVGSVRIGDISAPTVAFDNQAGQFFLSPAVVLGDATKGLVPLVKSYLDYLYRTNQAPTSPIEVKLSATVSPVAGQSVPAEGSVIVSVKKE